MTQHVFAGGLLFAALAACASDRTEEPPLTPASYVQTPSLESNSDSTEPESAETCLSNEECEAGFACMYDPERSQAVRYCLRQ
jgi:hypothetical protein